MRLRGIGRLKRTAQKLRNRLAPGGLVLLYHRVAEVPSDPFKLCVSPRNFAEQLEVLQQQQLKHQSQPMRLQNLAQMVREGKSPHRSIAITFDDGYVDNLHHAKPLLEQFEIPATVFVATGNIESQREFWWDELERLVLQPGRLPKLLSLNVGDRTYSWDLGEAAEYSAADYQRDRTWTWYVPEDADPSPRQRVFRSLYQFLQPLLPIERQRLMDELLAQAGVTATGRDTHRSLSPTEVRILAAGGAIEVGAHTVTHPKLSALPAATQRQEIKQSKSQLEAILERSVTSFAYPHGDYTEVTAELVAGAGFGCACSTRANRVRRQANCFQIPRVEVGNWDGDTFAKQLARWFYD
jgi:peptidoglycan/xylan/chitin deacetylase (PgdA/CDA1 family)